MPASTQNKAKQPSRRSPLGQSLVNHNLINQEQLDQALKRRTQVDMPLGSILIEMGFITVDKMLSFLSQKFGVPAINLFEVDIPPEVLQLIDKEKMQKYRILPISVENNILTLAMVSPQDFMTISDLEFTLGKKIQPAIVPFFMMEAALNLLSENYQGGIHGADIENLSLYEAQDSQQPPPIEKLFTYLAKSGGSDMLLSAGVPPSIKIGSILKRLATVALTPAHIEAYTRQILSNEQWEAFNRDNELETGITYKKKFRFRITFYRQRSSISIAVRHLPETIPSLEELNLPNWLKDYALSPQGLLLISGPAGNGKSTTLSAILDIINTNRRCNIITLEEPIEFLHKHKKSNVNQREVGKDTESFEEGLRGIFRQAPDVIVIGEMRDRKTFEIAIRAARTGHLVLSTMNSFDSTAVIQTIINMFPVEQQGLIRMMLADSLRLSLSQRLVKKADGSGMLMAVEKLANSHRVKSFIREDRIHHIRSQMETGAEEFIPLDVRLAAYAKAGQISFEEGLLHATNPVYFQDLAEGQKKKG
ncbi:MAG TPA: PilT/PilU family type 4a pilus ATPase [Desulfosalsimonadaceae bacterium]|nr:PilT/PilU family type 4a pilus ATPase [Desulfosalsimonadaceae bacterium]